MLLIHSEPNTLTRHSPCHVIVLPDLCFNYNKYALLHRPITFFNKGVIQKRSYDCFFQFQLVRDTSILWNLCEKCHCCSSGTGCIIRLQDSSPTFNCTGLYNVVMLDIKVPVAFIPHLEIRFTDCPS